MEENVIQINVGIMICVNVSGEIIEETKTVTTNFNEKNAICKTKNFYILLLFFLITIGLLIVVSIYYYLIKYKSKQKHYHITSQMTI